MKLLNNNEVRQLIKNSNKEHYVYGLCYDDGMPFYIGKGKKDRIFHHESHARNYKRIPYNPYKIRVIRKIWREKKEVKYYLYNFYSTSSIAEEMEIQLIESIGLNNLTNISSSSYGHTNWSDKSRKSISESMLLAHKKDPDLARRIGSAFKDAIKADPTIRDRMSIAAKNRFSCNEERLKQSKRVKQSFINDPTLKERQIRTLKYRNKNDPSRIQKYRQITLDVYKNRPEVKTKISNTLKELYKNNPTIQIKKGQSRKENNIQKRILRKKCLKLINDYSLDAIPPNGYQGLKTFQEFYNQLLLKIRT